MAVASTVSSASELLRRWKDFANEEAEIFHKIWIFGENFRAGNCSGFCNHQGSAPKRGRRGTRTPRCCVRGRKPLQGHQDDQYKETKEFLEPLVLSQLLVTFLWREKLPAGGITPDSTPSAKREQPNSVRSINTNQVHRRLPTKPTYSRSEEQKTPPVPKKRNRRCFSFRSA